MRRLLLVLGLALALGGVAVGGYRVVQLEQRELQAGSAWTPLGQLERVSAREQTVRRRLVTAELRQGESMEVEVCTRDGMPPQAWRDAVAFEMVYVAEDDVVVRAPTDEARLAQARRSARGACLTLAQGSELPMGGEFAVDATWPRGEPPPAAVLQAPVRARVLAWTPLSPQDRWPVAAAFAGAVLIPLSLLVRRPRDRFERALDDDEPPQAPEPPEPPEAPGTSGHAGPEPAPSPAQLVIGVAVLVLAGVAVSFVPFGGSAVGLAQGLALAGVQILIAFVLVRLARGRTQRVLGLQGPARWWLLLLAPAFGVAVRFAGGVISRLVPATGEAPIEAFVSMPSGMLALATVAVLVPLAEELFFRGFVWGAAERWLGPAAAFGVTVLLFALAHVPQLWGAWGSLVSVTLTGVVLTALRWWSGSTLVPALAHLAHNAIIVTASLA